MYLSYSGLKVFLTCPREYWHKYVNKTPVVIPENRINMLYGTVVGGIFEAFYRDKLYRSPNITGALLELAEPYLINTIREEVRKGGVINWADPKANYHSFDSLLDDVREAIPNGLKIIKQERFLGPFAEAEMKLDINLGGHILGGRADFVIERTKPHGDLIILDGKGSRHRGKFVDGMQLRWYAMLYRLKFKRIPDKLGFVFWRYPPNKAVDWEDFTPEGLTQLSVEVLGVIKHIEKWTADLNGSGPEEGGPFPAVADSHHCGLCSFCRICPEGTAATTSPLTLVPGGVSAIEDVSLDP